MHVVCPGCQAVNRVSLEKAETTKPVCGKCKAILVPEAPGFPLESGDADFETLVQQAKVPVLVDFWSSTCPPCRRLEPELKALAREMAGKLRVVKVNVEQNRRVPGQLGVRAVPTLVLFRGEELARCEGFRPLAELRGWVTRSL